jgi:hypothetical protein
MEKLFVIKDIKTNRYYIEDWRNYKNWSLDILDGTTYDSNQRAMERINTDNDIPEGMYQVESYIKKPEINYGDE